ncbi:MAG: ComEC/Rec2 family competence protein [Candidatus Paceibacterota bacterium]
MDRNRKIVLMVLSGLFLLDVFLAVLACDLNKKSGLIEVNFFDVGQGDSALIEITGYQILIDGGPDQSVLEKLSGKMPFWDRDIDLVILSHPESDHLSGLLEVLKRYKVENILWTGVVRDTAVFREWGDLIEKEGAYIKTAQTGQKINLSGDAYIEILSPFEDLSGKELKDSNDTSIVARLVFGGTSFLFTGDIDKSVEKDIVDRNPDLTASVIKVAHHGSKTSTSEEFVNRVLPEYAVISVGGDNKYGHPTQEVLDILSKYGIMIFRTDEVGDIKIISNGEKYAVSNFQN